MCVHTVDNGCYVYTLTGYRIHVHVHIHTVDDDCYMHVLIGFMYVSDLGSSTSVLVPDCN